MASWLLALHSDELPSSLIVEKECVLKSGAEDQPMVRYTRHILSTEEVRKHVREGKLPTQLALSWEGKASFVLTDNLQFKKLSFLDGTEPDSVNTQGEDKFDANVVLSNCIALCCCQLVPAHGFSVVLYNPLSVVVHHANV